MKRKHLEAFLQQLESFDKPRLDLEQYSTPANLGSSIIEAIHEDVELNESTLLGDLGCGCGVLMLGAARMGAGLSIGFEVDDGALSICQQNIRDADLGPLSRYRNMFDVVVINPPFGTKNNEGTDLRFIEIGLALLKPGGSLYSLHKTSTRKFLLRRSQNEWKTMCQTAETKAQLSWNLDKTYGHQKAQSVDISVDLLRLIK